MGEKGCEVRGIVRELPLKTVGPFFSLISRTFHTIRKRGITSRGLETVWYKEKRNEDSEEKP